MNSQLPILLVIVPLLAAPLCLFIKKPTLVWLFASIVSVLALLFSLIILSQVWETGELVYSLGGWQAPIGIEYRIDLLNAYLSVIVAALACICLLAAYKSIGEEIKKGKQTLFYVTFLLCLAGMLGVVVTGDVFNLFVFMEIAALSSYVLIAMGKNRKALIASLTYLLVGTLGATFILIGIGLVYMLTGSLNMQDLSVLLLSAPQSNTLFTAFTFFFVGTCLKLALFPLHWWLPNAYTYAPSIVSVFLAATATKIAIYILLRVIFSLFGSEFSYHTLPLQNILMTLGLAGILVCSVIAIFQQDLKQIFAYSSVAQVAYMMLALGMNNISGLMATLLHLFNHALMKGALFLALACIMYRLKSVQLSDIAGLGWQMPWTMAAIVIAGFSLIGLPLTVGFISKWYMLLASFENAWQPIALVILFGSLLAAVYIWRIVEKAYFSPLTTNNQHIKEAPLALLVPTWLLVLANLYFGIDTRFSLSISLHTAQMLLGVAP